MPVTVPVLAGALSASLASASFLGIEVPRLSSGIATGVSTWIPQVVVMTVDTGSAGSGSGGPMPLIVPQPSLLANLTAGFAASGLVGIYAAPMALGISNGLATALISGLVKTTHVGVGTGAGVATFRAPPATPSMTLGLRGVGFLGIALEQLANAIGTALDTTFASLLVSIPIVGSASPSGASGTGIGNII